MTLGTKIGNGCSVVTRLLALGSLLWPTGASVAHAQIGSLELGTPVDVTANVMLSQPVDFAVAPDGSLVIADLVESTIRKLSREGELLWTRGRSGDGPLEFRILYRIAVDADGKIVAFDAATGRLTWIDPDGEYLSSGQLPFPLRVDGIEVVNGGGVAVAGVANWGVVSQQAVHIFDGSLRHLRSFGPLPEHRNPRALNYWGAGSITWTVDNHILFTRRGPYQILRLSPLGDVLARVDPPFELEVDVDGAYIEERGVDGRLRIRTSDTFVPRPLAAFDLGDGWILAGRWTGPELRAWDLFDYEGELHATDTFPDGWLSVAGVDHVRQVLYIRAEGSLGEALYLKVPYRISQARSQ